MEEVFTGAPGARFVVEVAEICGDPARVGVEGRAFAAGSKRRSVARPTISRLPREVATMLQS